MTVCKSSAVWTSAQPGETRAAHAVRLWCTGRVTLSEACRVAGAELNSYAVFKRALPFVPDNAPADVTALRMLADVFAADRAPIERVMQTLGADEARARRIMDTVGFDVDTATFDSVACEARKQERRRCRNAYHARKRARAAIHDLMRATAHADGDERARLIRETARVLRSAKSKYNPPEQARA